MDSSTLLGVLRSLREAENEEDLLFRISGALRDAAKADHADIMFRDAGDSLVMRASVTSPEFAGRLRLGKGVGLVGEAIKANEALFVSSGACKHPKYARFTGLVDHDAEAVSVLPWRDDAGRIFAVVVLSKDRAWKLGPRQQAELQGFAQAAAEAYLGYQAAYNQGASGSRLGALSEVTKTISTSPYLEEILQLLVNITAQQFEYRVCTVRLLDEARGELVLRATQAPAKAYQKKRAIKLGESIAGRAIEEKVPIIVPDVQVDEDYIGHDLAVEQGLRSMICVPMIVQDRAVGVLSCYTSEVRPFAADEIKALETLAQQAAVSIENAKLQVRNTLMQEMHHRVKNNLQQVASLLRLQIRHATYQSVEQALNDCLARILAIASVHDLLSREDLDHVAIRSIAETLVHHQQASLLPPEKRIRFEVRGHETRLNMTQATQVALALNELIQNAVDHGFETTNEGEIHINIEQHDTEVGVWVSNNGDTLPDSFDITKASNLGLRIVDNLARALGGRFRLENKLGWTVGEIKFQRLGEE